MADKSISELSQISSVTGDEYFYGVQGTGDVKIVADELADYILNSYEFRQDNTNRNVVGGMLVSLGAITDISDLADKTYPVGSLFWSKNSTSPASRFGGSWARVKDVFALAAGSTYVAGTSGGTAAHLLTISEMPSHNHVSPTGKPSTNTSGASSGSTGNNSVGHTHSIPALSGTAASNGAHTHTLAGGTTGNSSSVIRADICTYNSSFATAWPSPGNHTHTVSTTAKASGNNSVGHTHTLNHTHTLSNHTHTITA